MGLNFLQLLILFAVLTGGLTNAQITFTREWINGKKSFPQPHNRYRAHTTHKHTQAQDNNGGLGLPAPPPPDAETCDCDRRLALIKKHLAEIDKILKSVTDSCSCDKCEWEEFLKPRPEPGPESSPLPPPSQEFEDNYA